VQGALGTKDPGPRDVALNRAAHAVPLCLTRTASGDCAPQREATRTLSRNVPRDAFTEKASPRAPH